MQALPPVTPPPSPLDSALRDLESGSDKGRLADVTEFAPGIALRADPALGVAGDWRSPAGRLLELDVRPRGTGGWIALHLALGEIAGDWLGLFCRSAAPEEVLIRVALRSGTAEGFTDSFLPRHILALPEPMTHADALHLPTTPDLPAEASWRELVIFLPARAFTWQIHDLKVLTP